MELYPIEAVEKLKGAGSPVRCFDTEILIKEAPDGRIGSLDRYEYALDVIPRTNYGATLEGIRRSCGWTNRSVNTVEILTDVFSVAVGDTTVRVWTYRRRKPYDRPARVGLVYAHGGAFVAGTPNICANTLKYIAELSDCVVFSIEYGLAPEHPYPSAVDACEAVVRHVHDHAEAFGVDPDKLCVGGDSAGTIFMLSVLARGTWSFVRYAALYYPCITFDYEHMPFAWRLDAYDIDPSQRERIEPRLNIGRSDGGGNLQYQVLLRSMYLAAGGDPTDADVSPIYADLRKMPKTLVLMAEFDGLRQQDEYLVRKLRDAGVEARGIRYQGLFHAFAEKIGVVPQAADACREIANDLRLLDGTETL